ncbi:hypothetical protein [Planomicrobium sp. CPCC 101110]|uniref:hypothetical protein n=1 Tax=Planomicrobium sp. CPCC 101110 TaxID=2599619 RepID=UPI0011B6AFC2|nr:hypothetical protein [Planomicrobium sp. CPCC 101110]TWT28368.1 hypothetical protein FQV30_07655 [Planomicrobium sp. CPCC 101110]
MKYIMFYSIPLAVFLLINNAVGQLSWPYFLVVLLSFLLFQMGRLRFPKGAPLPPATKLANAAFYAATVAFALRDRFLDPLVINLLIGITIVLVIADMRQVKKEPSL